MTELPVRARARSSLDLSVLASFGRATLSELAQDRLLYLVIGASALAALGLAAALGLLGRIDFLAYAPVWPRVLLLVVASYVAFVEVPRSIRADPAAPLRQLLTRIRSANAARLAAGLVLALAMGLFLGVFTSVKTMLPLLTAFGWDRAFADLDHGLHGADPWRLLHPLMGRQAVTRAVEFVYTNLWGVAVLGMVSWCAWAPLSAGRRRRFMLTYMLCWIVLGTLMAGLFYSAGPCYYAAVTGDAARYAALTSYHAGNADGAQAVHLIQQTLWRMHEAGRMDVGSGISAFPSMHVSMATLVVIMAFCINRRLGYASLGWLLLILASSVHLGWHYAVDGYASILVTLGIWFALKPLEKTARPHAGRPAPAGA